jgi:hypothetical protein
MALREIAGSMSLIEVSSAPYLLGQSGLGFGKDLMMAVAKNP